jgi:hypothetical protein
MQIRRIVAAKTILVLAWLATSSSCDRGEPSFSFAVVVRVDADDVTLHAPEAHLTHAEFGLPFWNAEAEYPDYETALERGIVLETRRNGELVDRRSQLSIGCPWRDDAPPMEGLVISSIVVDVDGRFLDPGSCTRCYGGDVGVERCP